jgi:hypothetical protein
MTVFAQWFKRIGTAELAVKGKKAPYPRDGAFFLSSSCRRSKILRTIAFRVLSE